MFREYLRLALRTLRTYRLRSALTVLSITMGVMAVILLTSFAQSALATLSKGIEEIGGTRFSMIWGDSAKKAAKKTGNYLHGMTEDDARALARNLPMVEAVTGAQQNDDLVPMRRPGEQEVRSDLVGADADFTRVFNMPIAKGRGLQPLDLQEHAAVCLVGSDLADKAFPGEEAVGQELIVKGRRYRVVGRLAFSAKGGMNFGFSWNDLAIIPVTVDNPTGRVSFVAMLRAPGSNGDELLDRANALLLHRHNQVDDFQIFDMGGMLKGFYAVFFAMILIVGLIAGMSLVIGGVGIMNIMLVAVAERKREIGLRKAMGATPGGIMRQFLVESVVLSLSGASVGVALGLGLAALGAFAAPLINKSWVGVVSQPAVFAAIAASAGIGIFFGWYPARQAALLDPILCLRSE